jgi:predicted DNA-binding transcriptional regulator AlpA
MSANLATRPKLSATLETLLRYSDLTERLRVGRRTLERMVASGEFPEPDKRIRRACLWKESTVARWVNAK